MGWEIRLTAIYTIISEVTAKYKCEKPRRGARRRSKEKALTDPEVLTISMFGLMHGFVEDMDIYHHTSTYLHQFFPNLGSYSNFNARKNECSFLFEALFYRLHKVLSVLSDDTSCWTIDSMPIALAKGGRSFKAKGAKGIADKGYCSSKKLHYYGIKLHVVGCHQNGTIPTPTLIKVTNARMHDLTAGRSLIKSLKNGICLGDKAYSDSSLQEFCKKENKLQLFTPVKKPKNGELTDKEIAFSKTVSKWRQPIESLFSWIQNHSKIQDGSKIRSTRSLAVHIYSRLSTAFMTKLFGKYFAGVDCKNLCLTDV